MAKTSDLQKMFERGKKQIQKVGNTKAGSWGANMLRSLGRSSLEVVKGISPNMADMTESAIEASKDLREQMMEAKSQNKTLRSMMDKNVYVGIGKDWFRNALEDLKSGNLNNKERQEKVRNEAWGLDDFDFDFGDDNGGGTDGLEDFDDGGWGDDDWGDSFEDDITSDDGGASASFATKSKNGATVTQVAMYNNIGPDSPIVQSTDNQTQVLIKSSEISTNTTIASTQALLQVASKVGNDITKVLVTMSDTMSDVNSNVTKILSEHQAASVQYYSDSMGVQNSILEEIKQIRETMTTQIATTAASTVREKRQVQDVLDMFHSGSVDVKEYAEYVKKNMKSMLESNFYTGSLIGISSDTDYLKEIAANPLSFIPKSIIGGLIPSVVKSATKELDETVSNFVVTALTKLGSAANDYDANPLVSGLGKLFGIQNQMVTKIDQSNYEKGPVPWDGVSRRTLNDVIPTYLSQIAAAVTGTEQMVFDYERGTYTTLRSIREERDRRIESAKTAPFFEDIMQFNEMVNSKYTNASADELNKIKDTFRNMIIRHVNTGGGGNYRVRTNSQGDKTDYLSDITGLYTDDPILDIIRGFFEGRHAAGNNTANLEFFGRKLQEARSSITRSTEQAEKDPIRYNAQYIDTGLENVSNTHMTTYDNGKTVLKGTGGPTADKYGKRPAEYLRDILIRLNKGILVEVTNGIDTNYFGNTPPRGDIAKSSEEFLEKTRVSEEAYNEDKAYNNNSLRGANGRFESDVEYGKVDSDSIDKESATMVAQEYHAGRLEDDNLQKFGNKSIIAKMAKFLPKGMQGLLLSWDEQLQKLGGGVAKSISKANDFIYTVLFGKEDGTSVMKDILNRLKASFDGFKSFMKERILEPADEALFGDEGVITKLKESEIAQDIKETLSNVKEKIFGTKITDENGNTKYEGGLLGDTMTELRNMGKSVKESILGGKDADGNKIPLDKDTSVLGYIKRMGKSVGDSITNTIGLGNKDDKVQKPLGTRLADKLDDVWDNVKDRFGNWADMILGPEVDNDGNRNIVREGIASFREDMKGQGGAVGAGAVVGAGAGALGLLGGVFLPGGPIGGALLGAGVAMVNRSETLQNILFGPKDEDGTRLGGIINKDIQDFFKDNKTGIKIGGFAGLLGSMGFLPAMLVPGGPIGGALIGGALSMATRTEVFQEFLYGKDGTKEDPTGGLMKKVKDAFGKDKDLKGMAINGGIGAGVGLIGSFFLPGGPILGALVGSALNIGANTEKFKTFMFGEEEFDEEGNSKGRKGGLFGQVTDFVHTQIFSPLLKTAQAAQIKMIGFVEQEMIAPLLSAISPITNKLEEIGIDLKNGVSKFFGSLLDKFNNTVVAPIGEALQPFIDKMKSILSKIFGGLFKAMGAVISSPFKMIGAIGTGIFERDKRRGSDAAVSDELRSIIDFKGRKEQGERMGLFGTTVAEVDENGNPTGKRKKVGRGLFGRLIYANSKENREKGAYSDKGAGNYATAERNPYTIRDDYIAKSKAKEAERLAKLNGTLPSGAPMSPMDRIRDWLGSKDSSMKHRPKITKGDPAFIEVYQALVDAQVANPGEIALQTLGIETDDVPGTVAKLLGNKPDSKKKKGKTTSGGVKTPGSSSDTKEEDSSTKPEADTATSITTAVTDQTNTSIEQHKETIGIITTIKEKLEILTDRLLPGREDKTNKSDNQTVNTTVPVPIEPLSSETISESSRTRTTDTSVVNDDKDAKPLSKKDKNSIARDVSRISDSVYGQLNGVGSNVNKIYRLLLKLSNTSDDDIKGDNNKEYVGFFGRIRTMLNNPIKMVMNVIMTPVRIIEGAFNKIGGMFSAVGNFLVSSAKGLWEGVKQFGAGVLQAGLSILQLPVEMVKMLGSVVANSLPVLKEVLVGGIKVATSVVVEGVKVAGSLLLDGVRSLGSIVYEAATGFGELVGGTLSGLGNLLYGAGLIGKEFLTGIAKGIAGTFKLAGKAITGTLSLGADIITSKLFGKDGNGLFGNRTMDVHVVGGILDEVTYIASDDPDCQDRTIDNFNDQTNRIIELLDEIIHPKPKVREAGDRNARRSRMNLTRFGYKNTGSSIGSELVEYFEEKEEREAEEATEAKERDEYETRVASGSSESQKEKTAEEAREEAEEARHTGMMAKLSELIGTNKEHTSGWANVFDLKKGVITLGLLAAVPLLLKLLPFIKNTVWPAIQGIFSVVGSIFEKLSPIIGSVGELLAKFGIEFGGELAEQTAEGVRSVGGLTGIINNTKELDDDLTKPFTGVGNETIINPDGTVELTMDSNGNPTGLKTREEKLSPLERAGSLLFKKKTTIDTETGKAYKEYEWNSVGLSMAEATLRNAPVLKTLTKKASTVAGEAIVDKVVDPVISAFINMAKPAFETIGEKIISFVMGEGVEKAATSGIKSMIKEWSTKLFNVKLLGPVLEKISKFMADVSAKVATAAQTLMLSELPWVAFGLIVTNPAHVFHVNKADVDWIMTAIAKFFGTILSTTLGSIMDFVCQLGYELFGVDLICVIATAIYNCFGESEKEKLATAQQVFKDDFNAFRKQEYDAYSSNAAKNNQAALTYDQFIQSELATSEKQYLRSHNRNLAQKAGDAVIDSFNAVNKEVQLNYQQSEYAQAIQRTSASGAWQRDEQYGGYGGDDGTRLATPTEMNGAPYFSQNDPQYKNYRYNLSDGSVDTMANRGCGPTAMAMIGKAYGAKTDPTDMAEFSTDNGYSTDIGTDPRFFNAASRKLGLASKEMDTNQENLTLALATGSPVLIQGRDVDPNSPFTAKGHYVVGTRLANNAGVAINDPRGPQYSGIYPMDKVTKGAAKMWTFNGGESLPSMEETSGGFGVGDTAMNQARTTVMNLQQMVTPEKVVKIAAAEVGYIEKQSNSQLDDPAANPGSANYTKYNQCVGSNPQFWCAAFVCWCFEQACGGDKEKLRQLLCGSKSAACNTLMQQFKSAGRFDNSPKVGDQIFFSGSRHSGANHIGIVVGVDGQTVYTIEGNTSGTAGVVDNGGEVAFKSYPLTSEKILGYGHPAYDGETNFGGITSNGQIGTTATGVSTGFMSYDDSSSNNGVSGITGFFSTLASNVGNAVMKALGFKVNDDTTVMSGSSSMYSTNGATNASGISGNTNTEKIWNYFRAKGLTEEGISGLMGNLEEESGFQSDNMQNSFESKLGMNDQTYTAGVDSGSYGNFVNDSVGYGLAQWTYSGRKKNLLDFKNRTGASIGDLGMQLDFLDNELQTSYPSVYNALKTATDVQQASDIVLTQFEQPGDQSQNMKNKRGSHAKKWYDTYKGLNPSSASNTTTVATSGGILDKLNISNTKTSTNNNNNIFGMGGFGDGCDYAEVKSNFVPTPQREMRPAPIRRNDGYGGFGTVSSNSDKIVDLLIAIAGDTSDINMGIDGLNEKEFPVVGGNKTQNVNIYEGDNHKTETVQRTVSTSNDFEDDTDSMNRDYLVAKRLARSLAGI